MGSQKTDYAIKQIARALIANEDEGFKYSAENAVARAIHGIGDSFNNEVLHYLSAYAAIDKWRDGLGVDYRNVAVGGPGPLFTAGRKPNRSLGFPEDEGIPQLAIDIANGCSTYLRYFDTDGGHAFLRNDMPVAVHSLEEDKTYGVGWSIITKRASCGGNYTRTLFSIDDFEHGREFLLSMVYFLYGFKDYTCTLCNIFDECHDWTNELFGELNEKGEVVNLKLKKN